MKYENPFGNLVWSKIPEWNVRSIIEINNRPGDWKAVCVYITDNSNAYLRPIQEFLNLESKI